MTYYFFDLLNWFSVLAGTISLLTVLVLVPKKNENENNQKAAA
ncbi:hypothetical protein [Candidatus Clostridium radicumherbarum]|uniref:Holin n=1 Tax=Candidatus Clostridium radicumherbarum TaxID=3381662 RepID=A0ABW8TWT0_9CLOT